ncbi:MAG TPA: hypothetical protein VF916_05125, partial [Ktedonobacterales bacterium]
MKRRDAADAAEHFGALRQPAGKPVLWRLVQAAAVDLGPLRVHRDFRLLFLGQLVSFFGNTLT